MARKTEKAASVTRLSRTKPNVRILSRFTGYSTEDCRCEFCLYYGGKKKGCTIEVCCCLEERAQALEREKQKNNNGGSEHEQK